MPHAHAVLFFPSRASDVATVRQVYTSQASTLYGARTSPSVFHTPSRVSGEDSADHLLVRVVDHANHTAPRMPHFIPSHTLDYQRLTQTTLTLKCHLSLHLFLTLSPSTSYPVNFPF